MKIERIELFHVAMPLIYPWRTAYGEDAAIHSVLCHMVSGSVDGWGESTPLAAPCYSPEWAGGVFHTISEWLAPAVIGQEFESAEALQEKLSLYKGNPFAKAALDNAWWSLHSRMTNVPLHIALGATRNEVPVGADFGVMDHLDDLIADVGTAVEQNFPRIKLKFRPGWDVPMLKAIRSSFPEEVFHIDCNSGYRIEDADLFQMIDEFQLSMIEQPLQNDDLTDHARLQKMIKTPVCLDESITHPYRAQQAVDLKSCLYVNVKPGRVGGLTNAVKIHDICQKADIPCWVGGMLESATGSSHCTALAMLDNFTYPADIFPTEKYYREDLAEFPLQLTENEQGVPCVKAFEKMPDPDPKRLEALTIQQKTFK